MIKTTIYTLLFLTLPSITFGFPTKPERCPDPAFIAQEGLNPEISIQDFDGLWTIGMNRRKYDTTDAWWSFAIGRIRAKDKSDAFNMAIIALNGMSLHEGPYAITKIRKWACTYNNSQGYKAIAVTPSLEGIYPL